MTMFKDSVNKKMFAIDREGQYLFDFGIAEKEIAKSLTDAAIGIKEGASDENDSKDESTASRKVSIAAEPTQFVTEDNEVGGQCLHTVSIL